MPMPGGHGKRVLYLHRLTLKASVLGKSLGPFSYPNASDFDLESVGFQVFRPNTVFSQLAF